jgi:hypothetical protein
VDSDGTVQVAGRAEIYPVIRAPALDFVLDRVLFTPVLLLVLVLALRLGAAVLGLGVLETKEFEAHVVWLLSRYPVFMWYGGLE